MPRAPSQPPRMYHELAPWWPLLSAPADYAEEAAHFRALLDLPPRAESYTLLELGCGGGNLASHLKPYFRLTLTDLSPAMLAVSRALNPEAEHLPGDMRSLRLDRPFDVVLIHDAIMYCTTPDDVRAAIATAAMHCRPGGRVVIAPDCVRETFQPGTDHGGEDAPDGRGLRYLEWTYDPDPRDTSFEVVYSLVLREADGGVRAELDHHTEGLFPLADWLAWMAEAGLAARSVRDPWGRDVLLGAG